MDHYIAEDNLFVSQILYELLAVKFDDSEQKVNSLIQHEIQLENL